MVTRNRSIPSPTRIDREFLHQVALLDDLCVDRNFPRINDFCKGLGVVWQTRQVIAVWLNGKHENHRLHCFAELTPAAS